MHACVSALLQPKRNRDMSSDEAEGTSLAEQYDVSESLQESVRSKPAEHGDLATNKMQGGAKASKEAAQTLEHRDQSSQRLRLADVRARHSDKQVRAYTGLYTYSLTKCIHSANTYAVY
jgi:hypothetical protein